MDRRSPEQVSRHAVWLALARASFGAPTLAAPETVVRMLGLSRRRRDDSQRFFGGFLGVRELLLSAFVLAAREDLRRLGPTVAFGALADLGDTTLVVRELVRRQRIEPGVAFLLLSGLAGAAASVALWWEVRQVEGDPQAT